MDLHNSMRNMNLLRVSINNILKHYESLLNNRVIFRDIVILIIKTYYIKHVTIVHWLNNVSYIEQILTQDK